jgi:hypothetical protein
MVQEQGSFAGLDHWMFSPCEQDDLAIVFGRQAEKLRKNLPKRLKNDTKETNSIFNNTIIPILNKLKLLYIS